jgi:hypothetical protein
VPAPGRLLSHLRSGLVLSVGLLVACSTIKETTRLGRMISTEFGHPATVAVGVKSVRSDGRWVKQRSMTVTFSDPALLSMEDGPLGELAQRVATFTRSNCSDDFSPDVIFVIIEVAHGFGPLTSSRSQTFTFAGADSTQHPDPLHLPS